MLEWALLLLDPISKLALVFVAYELWTIKRNHLPHIYKALDKLNREVGVLIGKTNKERF